jgi:glycosyltransferase involved in cell wall biosynthesis
MKIFVNGRFLTQPMTGVQRYAHEMVSALDAVLDERPDLSIEILSPPLSSPAPKFRNIRHVEIGSRGGHFWEQTSLPKKVGKGILFCPGNTAPISSLLSKASVIVCVHDLSYLYHPRAYTLPYRLVYNVLTPLVLRHARKVITVSDAERLEILKHYPRVEPRLVAIQNGGLGSSVRLDLPRQPLLPEPGYMLYVGSLSKRKNFPAMFQVACDLATRRGLRTVFVGGTAASLEETHQNVPPHLAEMVTFAGQVNDTDLLVSYYKGASVFLFPSLHEASPLPPIEAMKCGVPVVSSAIPSLRERCRDAAIYCQADDAASITEAVEKVLDDEGFAAEMRERGRRLANEYSWRNAALRTLEVITG